MTDPNQTQTDLPTTPDKTPEDLHQQIAEYLQAVAFTLPPTHHAKVIAENLQAAVQAVRPVAKNNLGNPLMAHLILVAEHDQNDASQPGWVTLVARDYEREIRVSTRAMVTGEADQAAVYVPARTLADLLGTIEGHGLLDLGLATNALHITAQGGRNKTRLVGQVATEDDTKPAFIDPERQADGQPAPVVVTIPGAKLAEALANVMPTSMAKAGAQKGSPTIDVIHMSINGPMMTLTSTNGFALACTTAQVTTEPATGACSANLARDTMALVARLAGDLAEATIVIGQNGARFDLGPVTLTTTLIGANFPEIAPFVADARKRARLAKVTAPQADLARAIKGVARVSENGFFHLGLPVPAAENVAPVVQVEGWGLEADAMAELPAQVDWDQLPEAAAYVGLSHELITPYLGSKGGTLELDIYGENLPLFATDPARAGWFAMIMPAKTSRKNG